ncbi:hypothetical protein BBJ28_00000083 [Nothophytophthora sp. Chile5]|nr:hypothetical protein BBJ28_00000083 [Nothophytophthora sp. Chile5]
MLFLFDLYLYLPSSHRLDGAEIDGSDQQCDESCPPPALSLWILVYDSFTSAPQSRRETHVVNGKDFWALLQTVYRQRYFEELARCYIRGEPSGGYLRQSTPVSLKDASVSEDEEVLEGQLLALESTWDLLTVSEKDIRYLEREVDFYCKEILRGTTGRPACEVVAAQALYVLGSLLLEKKSNEYAIIFWGLNAKLESSVKDLQAVASIAVKPRDQERQRRLLQSKSFSPHCLLLPRACTATGVGSSPPTAVIKSLEHILSTGLEACLNAAISKVIGVDDLRIAMEIFQLVLPRARDDPKQCLEVVPVQGEVQGGHGEFDEFEDGMADVWANVDLDGLTATWSIDTCRPQVLQRITATSNLRMAVQQLVLHYPPSDDPTFEELYAIDLLGMMLSTCEVQFIWNNVTSTSVKPRNLAPRVLSAALKYNPEKEWLGNVFLKESGAAQELANAWLMGTLDVSALNSTLMPFKVKEAPFSIASGDTLTSGGVRDSNYWVMLTDGIIYHLLRNNPIGFYAMDPLVLQLLRGVASKCKFPLQIRANSDGLTDIAVLYDLHLDVFQAFCKSAGEMWHGFATAPSAHRQEMNQFRTKTMNPQSGIFMSFLE